ncbi:transcriptional repressor CTCFL-like [Teleopsis dalmanni]|uniref:transcriptional repressor CTCFL-like n=1 Tax=Teleopsis dalmanni TaxID=139649 RepID=UPI0018CCE2E6|nr:transcriptional repressor CTCFL-like [Teleopsis dalmanni]XP_037933709.1 transcriptional repressor CTCFL-like [Teleopsis dalmanni]
MSAKNVGNHDLQTYLDAFNEEIEEGDQTVVTLNSETIAALGCGDQTAQSLFSEGNNANVKDISIGVDGELFYVNETENSPKNDTVELEIQNNNVKGKVLRHKSKRNVRKEVVLAPAEEDQDAQIEYVVIIEGENQGDGEGDDLEIKPNVKEIYEFDETESVPENDKSVGIAAREGRLKQNANSSGELFKCGYCSYAAPKRYILSRHLASHSDYRPYKCSVCERGFKKNAALHNHMNVHLGKKPHQCKSCEMAFTTSGELLRHVRYRHTKEKPHKCTECDYCSVEVSKLTRHMRCHTGERPYQCPHCTYASPDTFKLKRHLRTHTGEKPYECKICHARFTQSNSLKSHLLIHSVGDKPIFQCELCPTTCGRKTDLRLHMKKLHHSDKPIKCKRCGKDLPDRYSYKQHIKSHEGEKCFICQYCPYRSVTMKQLNTHMLIHTDEKPFSCDQCTTKFRSRELLLRHTNIYHTTDYKPPPPRAKNHTCPTCQKKFTHKGNLMRHMETHDPDPDLQKEKLKIKIGRMTRVHPDGSIITLAPDYANENIGENDDAEDDDFYELEDDEGVDNESRIEYVETIDEDFEEKPFANVTDNDVDYNESTISIKNEPHQTEGYLTLEEVAENGEQFVVVEVIQCDDEELDEDENTLTLNNVIKIEDKSAEVVNDGNCFGFEEDIAELIEEKGTRRKRKFIITEN